MKVGDYRFDSPDEEAVDFLLENRFVCIGGILPGDANRRLEIAYHTRNLLQVHKRGARRIMSRFGYSATELYRKLVPEDVEIYTGDDELALPWYMQTAMPVVEPMTVAHRELFKDPRLLEMYEGYPELNLARFAQSPKDKPGIAFPAHQDSRYYTGVGVAAQCLPTRWRIWKSGDRALEPLGEPTATFETEGGDVVFLLERVGDAPQHVNFRDGEQRVYKNGSVVHAGTYLHNLYGKRFGVALDSAEGQEVNNPEIILA